jgi:16S rRNA G966 N2-methylase RsmD
VKAKENQKVPTGGKNKTTLQNSAKSIDTRAELAKAANVSHDTIHKVKVITEKAPERVKEKLRKGEVSINAAYKDVEKKEKQKQRETLKQPMPTEEREWFNLHVCDCLELTNKIEAKSVDFVITDPPYPKEFLPVYSDLSLFASKVLKPGGSLLCLVGQSYLPEILTRLSEHLDYHWTLAYLTPGGQAVQLWERTSRLLRHHALWCLRSCILARTC